MTRPHVVPHPASCLSLFPWWRLGCKRKSGSEHFHGSSFVQESQLQARVKDPSCSGGRCSATFQGVWVQEQEYLQPFFQTSNHTLCTTQLGPPSQNTTGWGLDNRHSFITVPEVRSQRLGPGESSLPGVQMAAFLLCPFLTMSLF